MKAERKIDDPSRCTEIYDVTYTNLMLIPNKPRTIIAGTITSEEHEYTSRNYPGEMENWGEGGGDMRA
jgi:hypothetical protein